jgi:hypothetical protein
MATLFVETMERAKYLRILGNTVKHIWECEFQKELMDNTNMSEYISKLDLEVPIGERDAFYGGRCDSTRLFYSVKPGEKIRYLDVCSLYPYICKYSKFVVGHPRVLTTNLDTSISQYSGIIKCTAVPPRGLFHPVLPFRLHGKLLFPLCRKCAEKFQKEVCTHSDEERALTGTWVSDELKKACTKGYRIVKVHEVWQYDRSILYDPVSKQGGLFTEYINTFLKLKQEASGWPNWVKTEEDADRYIDSYMKQEGIKLDAENIEFNRGLRSLAKICLVSFWGKFGQRDNMRRTTHFDQPGDFFELLQNESKVVTNITFPSTEIAEVQWEDEAQFASSSDRTNVIIAAYTTAHARLFLYDIIEKLGEYVCYMDTDSVIFIESEKTPFIPVGDFLGDLTDEIEPENCIVEFVSGGPKNYAYKLHHPDANGKQYFCKVKGISLNFRGSQVINFHSIKDLIVNDSGEEDSYEVTEPFKIVRNKESSEIISKSSTKKYSFKFDKRVVDHELKTYPYGY